MAEKISPVMLNDNVKAVVRFTGVGVPTILRSFNVASIINDGVGRYSIVTTNPVSTNSSLAGACGDTGGYNNYTFSIKEDVGERTANLIPIRSIATGASETILQDRGQIGVSLIGGAS